MEYEFSELEVQLQRLGCEEASLRNRREMSLRILRRGHDPKIIWELSQEGLDELEMRLARLEEEESQKTPMNWFILRLLGRKRQFPLSFDGLSKDQLCVKMVEIAYLQIECNELTNKVNQIEEQRKIIMSYESSEAEIANLDESKARIESESRQKQERLTNLKNNLGI